MINRVVRLSGPIDVHVISRPPADEDGSAAGSRRLPHVEPVLTPLSPRRQLWGWVLVVVGLPLITLAFANLRDTVRARRACCCSTSCWRWSSPSSAACCRRSSPSIGGFLLANWYFTPPFYELDDRRGGEPARPRRLRRRRRDRRRARRPGRAQPAARGAPAGRGRGAGVARRRAGRPGLGRATCSASCGRRSGSASAALLARCRATSWTVVERSGAEPPTRPRGGRRQPRPRATASRWRSPAARCRPRTSACSTPSPPRSPRRPSASGCNGEAGRADDLAAANTLRASLLQAVSHDLRTPLASIKASISSLRQRDVDWPPDDGRRVPGDDRGGDRPADRRSSATCST